MNPLPPLPPMPPMKPLGFERWWPADFGDPSSSGGQDGIRYAVFDDKRRLLVERDGHCTTYDLGDHRIAGIQSQGQGGGQAVVTFSGQHGPLRLDDLTVLDASGEQRSASRREQLGEGPRVHAEPLRHSEAQALAASTMPTASLSALSVAGGEPERVVFSEEGRDGSTIKIVVHGLLDGELIDAAEDFLRRQRRRLSRA